MKKMDFDFKMKNTFVFSRNEDLLCFYLPLLLAVLFAFATFRPFVVDIVFFTGVVLGAGHIAVTTLPTIFKWQVLSKKLPGLLGVTLFFVALYFYNLAYFKTVFNAWSLLHVFAQLAFWQRVLVPERSIPHRLLLASLLHLPFLIYIGGFLPYQPVYFYRDIIDLGFWDIPQPFLVGLATFNLVALLALSVQWRSDKVFNLGLFLYYFAMWVANNVLMFFLENSDAFRVYMSASHGAVYLLYISKAWTFHPQEKSWFVTSSFYKRLGITIVLACIGGYFLKQQMKDLMSASKLVTGLNLVEFFTMIPIMLHYLVDSTVWKRPRSN